MPPTMLKNRVKISSTLEKELNVLFDKLSSETRIDKSKYLDEAISDLLVKYGYKEPIK